MNPVLPSLAIIGAGVSGLLSAVNALESRNFSSITIFDRNQRLGGIWSPEGYAWPGMSCNITKNLMKLPFLVFDENIELYPRKDVVSSYLDKLALEYGLDKLILSESEVLKISQNKEEDFTIEWVRKGAQSPFVKRFDQVIVAIGRLSKMNFGPFERYRAGDCGIEVLHAGEYRTPESFTGKRVMVMGNSYSALQIASEVSRTAKKVINVFRNPRFVLKLQVYNEKYGKVLPTELYVDVSRNQRGPLAKAESKRTVNSRYCNLTKQNAVHPDLFISPDSEKKHGISMAESYVSDVQAGLFEIRKANFEEIREKRVILDSGEEIEVDVVIVGYGYVSNYHFLDEELRRRLEYRPEQTLNPLNLDLSYVYNRKVMNLAFVAAQPANTIWATNHFQALVAVQFLKNCRNYNQFYKRIENWKPAYVDKSGYIEFMAKELDLLPDFEFIQEKDQELHDCVMNGPFMIEHFALKKANFGREIWETCSLIIKKFNRELKLQGKL